MMLHSKIEAKKASADLGDWRFSFFPFWGQYPRRCEMIIGGRDLPNSANVASRVAEIFYPRKRSWEVSFEDFRIAILREVIKHNPTDEAMAFEIATRKAQELLAWSRSTVYQEYAAFTQQLEIAESMLREVRCYYDREKLTQAIDIFKNAILKIASVPSLLQPRVFVNYESGRPGEAEVLCFKSLIKAEKGGGLAIQCLFRDGLYWVPARDGDYLFAERVPVTDTELLRNFNDLKKAIHARIRELGSQPAQDTIKDEDDSAH
jgi:tetratricopeptide (TPR) repeat protein